MVNALFSFVTDSGAARVVVISASCKLPHGTWRPPFTYFLPPGDAKWSTPIPKTVTVTIYPQSTWFTLVVICPFYLMILIIAYRIILVEVVSRC